MKSTKWQTVDEKTFPETVAADIQPFRSFQQVPKEDNEILFAEYSSAERQKQNQLV